MRILLTLTLFCAVGARGEFLEKPDPNTLWKEDGKAIAGWREGLLIESTENGFRIEAGAAKNQYSTGRYVPLDSEYPWLTWRVLQVIPHQKGYRGWTAPFLIKVKHPHLGQVSHQQEGIYAINVAENAEQWPMKQDFLRMDLHGAALILEYIAMVREPANYLAVEIPDAARERGYVAPGDELTFRVVMAKPAEDVSLRFFHSYMMPQIEMNGQQALQLRLADDTKRVWSATTTLDGFAGGRVKDGRYAAGNILVKAVILGGGPGAPVWGGICWPVATQAGE